jgi:Ca2+-binding RTX toxin-like protein
MRLDGRQGSDELFGGGGADEFVFGPGFGSDTVLDFDLGADRVVLVDSGFADATEALAAFSQGTGGAELAFTDAEVLFLADIDYTQLFTTHLILETSTFV